MPSCSDPSHRHRTEAAARKCDAVRRAYQESNPGSPLYVPVEQRTVTVAQQRPAPKKAR